MSQQKMEDAGRAEHEAVGGGLGFVGQIVPRLMRAAAKERHQHIGDVRGALTPALLSEHTMRLEIDLADTRETVALTETVAADLARNCAKCSPQVLLRNGRSALRLRDAQPAERDTGCPVTPPMRWFRM